MATSGSGSNVATSLFPPTSSAIDKVPVLGSGKTDYVAATALAKERVCGDQKVA